MEADDRLARLASLCFIISVSSRERQTQSKPCEKIHVLTKKKNNILWQISFIFTSKKLKFRPFLFIIFFVHLNGDKKIKVEMHFWFPKISTSSIFR